MDKKPIKKEKLSKKVNANIRKLNKTILLRDPIASKSPWLEDYQDFFTGRLQPVNEGFLEHLGKELINFAETIEGPLRIEFFFISKRIPYQTGRDWARKYPIFERYYNTAKYILGMRREDGALRRNFSDKIYLQSAHRYDPESKEDAQFHAKLKQEVLTGMEGTKVIILDKLFEDKDSK